jgi:hypothetical protein
MSTTGLVAIPFDAVRPVPWLRLGWVTWRRHRSTVLATVAVLGLIGIYLVVSGFQLRSAWHAVQACTPQHTAACNFAWTDFKNGHSNPGILSALFLFAPLLVGAFAGAPLIGRELETGTFRYTWTQGVGRTRWAVAMAVTGAVVVAVLTGGFGALIAWHDHPLWQADITPRMQASEFPSTGIAPIGWALVAYGAGLLAGLLLRRVLPALGLAVVTTFGLAFAASKLRLHYLAPLKTSSLQYVPQSQGLSQWWEKAGRTVSTTEVDAVLRAGGLQGLDAGGGSVSAAPGDSAADPTTYLLQHGYTQWTSYQPGSRYWAFQWIEFGWLAAVALLLVTATVLLLRHRDA